MASIKERLSQNRIWYIALGISLISFGICVGMGIAGIYSASRSDPRDEIIHQLRPHIERVDQEQGISFKDQLDFARRAGLPTNEIMEGKPLDFYNIPKKTLEKVLNSYQSDNFRD